MAAEDVARDHMQQEEGAEGIQQADHSRLPDPDTEQLEPDGDRRHDREMRRQ